VSVDPLSALAISFEDVEQAATRLGTRVRRTPVLRVEALEAATGARLVMKAECLQRSGSFKYRGALNAVLAGLEREDRRPVVAVAGNHAYAVALAAREVGLKATAVMPEDGTALKLAAVQATGADVIASGVSQADRDQVVGPLAERGMRVLEADDPHVMAGHGTLALELLDQLNSDLPDALVVPVGRGSLIAGVATVMKRLAPSVSIIGAEPAAADDACQSLQKGQLVTLPQPPVTVADGLRATHLSYRAWPIVARSVDRIITVSEDDIATAMWLLWTRAKLLVEPSGAVGLAAVLAERARSADSPASRVRTFACLLTGANADPVELASLFTRARSMDLARLWSAVP
jgi:threo-3-hydroxy-L-aspartate ammonia-lyase